MVNVFFASLYGSIVGFVWAFALKYEINSGSLYGAIVGGMIGLLFFSLGKLARAGGNVTAKETIFVSGSIYGFFLLIGIVTGLIALLIRVVFFL